MSPVHTWLSAGTVKLRFKRLGAIGSSCRLSVVVTRKRRLPRARMSCCCISRSTRCLPTRRPAPAVPARCEAIRRQTDSPHTRHGCGPEELSRSNDGTPGYFAAPRQMLMVARYTHPQHSALPTDRPDPTMSLNKGVLHFWPFAKNAVAFPRMPRSIVTRADSARRRLSPSARHSTLPCLWHWSLTMRLHPVKQSLTHNIPLGCIALDSEMFG
jgi:hypothetical protein